MGGLQPPHWPLIRRSERGSRLRTGKATRNNVRNLGAQVKLSDQPRGAYPMFRSLVFVAPTMLLFSAHGSVAQSNPPPSADQIQPGTVTAAQDFASKAG